MADLLHIGIDFGTTTSAVSWWNPKTNSPEIIRNEHGDELPPTPHYFTVLAHPTDIGVVHET